MTNPPTETHRDLIVKYKIREDKKVDLWPKGLQHAELILFDVSDLQEAGIDWTAVSVGLEHPCRFWAYWTYSDKLKTSGNPYKDVLRLEPLNSPATATSVDASAIVAELRTLTGEIRAIKALLLAHVTPAMGGLTTQTAPGAAGTVANENPPADLSTALFGPDDEHATYHPEPRPEPVEGRNTQHEIRNTQHAHLAHLLPKPENGRQPPPDDPHRERFYAEVAAALGPGYITDDTVSAILADCNGRGWELAARCVVAEVHRAETWTDEQREKRHNVVARLLELLQSPHVKAGLIEHTLPPGWQWTAGYSDLVAEGKRLKAELAQISPNGRATCPAKRSEAGDG